ncbi:putative Alpha-tubulin N-acetyltransferase 1 [Hypsibius exemplaris]|uniref:Alpha-tubulin N-acetyltransferase n=1 Tax=Hypsibius exemplaris TaxID=2072580 RepID=A0A9X6RJT8_HYPEX|nr:putative Alpha-tubulin N-acetyltransferase 1 [Hypsibius exemplaris]
MSRIYSHNVSVNNFILSPAIPFDRDVLGKSPLTALVKHFRTAARLRFGREPSIRKKKEMDCGFNINHVLPEEITLLDASADFWKNTSVGGGREFMRQQICTVIDRIGEGSAQSQGFLTPITTSQKLRATDHRLYILKDATANGYRGGVIGYVKVARKKLLLVDPKGQQQQYEPLCLLDFFIDVPYQRQGHGTKLLNFVTKREHVQPQDLAIDRPSQKCLSFFSHKFNLTDVVRQPTPFVVFSEFFSGANNPGSAPLFTPESKTANGPLQKTYNGFYNVPSAGAQTNPPTTINMGGYKTEEMSTVNGDYGRSQNGGMNGQSDKPSPSENGGPLAVVITAEGVKEKQEKANMLPAGQDAFRIGSQLRPTKGANMHYTHTQLW